MLSPAEILGPSGRIAARLDHYEHRREQLAMAEAVAEALAAAGASGRRSGNGHRQELRLSGAGHPGRRRPGADGRGRHGRSGSGSIMLSTHTISLQEQLIHKDIPFLRSVMPVEFTAVLVKGRGNYLSLRRMENAAAPGSQLVSSRGGIRRAADRSSTGRGGPPTAR